MRLMLIAYNMIRLLMLLGYVAVKPSGPWEICISVPAVIYSIPPSAPSFAYCQQLARLCSVHCAAASMAAS